MARNLIKPDVVAELRVATLFGNHLRRTHGANYRVEMLTTEGNSFPSLVRRTTVSPSAGSDQVLSTFLNSLYDYFRRALLTARGNPGSGWKADVLGLIIDPGTSLFAELIEVTTKGQADKTADEDVIKHLEYLKDAAKATQQSLSRKGIQADLSVYASPWRPAIDELFYYIAPSDPAAIKNENGIKLRFLSLLPTFSYVPPSSTKDRVIKAGFNVPGSVGQPNARPGLDGLILYEILEFSVDADLRLIWYIVSRIRKMLRDKRTAEEIQEKIEKMVNDPELKSKLENAAVMLGIGLFLTILVLLAAPILLETLAAILLFLAGAEAIELAAAAVLTTLTITLAGEKVANAALPRLPPQPLTVPVELMVPEELTVRKSLQLPGAQGP